MGSCTKDALRLRVASWLCWLVKRSALCGARLVGLSAERFVAALLALLCRAMRLLGHARARRARPYKYRVLMCLRKHSASATDIHDQNE